MRPLLIVDDDEDIRGLVTLVLELSGQFAPVAVATIDEALAALDAADFDAVLLDMSLAGCSGHEVLERMAVAFDRTSVILFTASVEVDAMAMPQVSGIIRKPFDPLTLADDISAVLANQTTH